MDALGNILKIKIRAMFKANTFTVSSVQPGFNNCRKKPSKLYLELVENPWMENPTSTGWKFGRHQQGGVRLFKDNASLFATHYR